MPDSYLLIAAVALLVFALSWLVTPGAFDTRVATRADGAATRLIDPDSFRYVDEQSGATLFSSDEGRPGLFNAVYEGLVSGSRTGGAVGIIAFILLTGGAFGVVMGTGSIERGLRRLVTRSGSTDSRLMLVGLFVAFSLGGAVFGMGEEVIPFVLMLTPALLSLGYDRVLVVLVTYAATQVGFATSWMNPFNVAIAQGIADLPLLSGLSFRLVMWVSFTLLGALWTYRYATRCRAGALESPGEVDWAPGERLSLGDWLILLALALTVLWIVWGVTVAGYYLPEIATQFVVLAVVAGVVGCRLSLDGMTPNRAMEAFRGGAQALLPAALIIGFARGIVYLMGGDDPSVPSLLNTLLHLGSEALGGLPAWLAAWFMFLGQSVFNFFVTSGSGQAALTMPLIAPLSDLIGVSRQVAVLAFQLGDGLTNLVVPTSAVLMGCLGAAGLDWQLWLRRTALLFFWFMLLASAFVLAGVFTGLT